MQRKGHWERPSWFSKAVQTTQDLETLGFRGASLLTAACFLYLEILFRVVAGQRLPLGWVIFNYTSTELKKLASMF